LLHRIEDIVRKLRALAGQFGFSGAVSRSPKKDNNGMKRFTDAIAKAVVDKNWLAALALALTMPDVCGRMEHPKLGSERRYKAWWDKYMLDRYRGFLSGGDAYALRCAYVHEGSGKILDQRAREALTHFRFVAPNETGIPVHNFRLRQKSGGTDTLVLQVDVFCRDMTGAVSRWSDEVTSNQAVQQRLQSLLQIHNPLYTEGSG
jgi:hypothetical protein